MTWVDLSASFSYGSQLTSTQMQNLRDNITALANGDAGAPEVQTAALADNCVTNAKLSISAIDTPEIADDAVTEAKLGPSSTDQTALKTSTGSVTGTANREVVAAVMEDYCFSPSVWADSDDANAVWKMLPRLLPTDSGVTTGRFSLENTADVDGDYSVRWRYVTATDRPFIYAILDKEGRMRHVWACEDPPTKYWHLKERPKNFDPPIIITDLKRQRVEPAKEIVIFDYEHYEYHDLMARAFNDKKLLHRMLTDDYELMDGSQVFTRKNLSQI